MVDDESVTAPAANEGVYSAAAVQHIVAGVADQRIPPGITGAIDVVDSDTLQQSQVLDVREAGDAEADRALHRVLVAATGGSAQGLHNLVTSGIDFISIVAFAAGQRVIARPPVELVVAVAAGQRIVELIADKLNGSGIGQR